MERRRNILTAALMGAAVLLIAAGLVMFAMLRKLEAATKD